MKMLFTNEEIHLLKEFRLKVADLLEDDFEKTDEFLITWIRYKNHDVKKAEQALRANKKWRAEFGIAELVSKDMKDMEAFIKIDRPGFDKDGCPIGGVKLDTDVRKILLLPDGRQRYLKFMLKNCEIDALAVRKQFLKTEGQVSQFISIVNMDGFVFGQITSPKAVSTLIELLRNIEDNYPGLLKTLYVLNTPRMFKIVFDIFKPFFSPETLSRLRMYDSNKAQWRKALLENISEDQLPAFAK